MQEGAGRGGTCLCWRGGLRARISQTRLLRAWRPCAPPCLSIGCRSVLCITPPLTPLYTTTIALCLSTTPALYLSTTLFCSLAFKLWANIRAGGRSRRRCRMFAASHARAMHPPARRGRLQQQGAALHQRLLVGSRARVLRAATPPGRVDPRSAREDLLRKTSRGQRAASSRRRGAAAAWAHEVAGLDIVGEGG